MFLIPSMSFFHVFHFFSKILIKKPPIMLMLICLVLRVRMTNAKKLLKTNWAGITF